MKPTHSSPESILATITDAITERVEPLCRHFGECGGCQLQHLPQPSQLAAKRATLIDVLRRAGITTLPEIQAHAAEPWHYRNRIRMRVQGPDIGYSRRASNDFLPIAECPIASPLLLQMAMTARDLVRSGATRWPAETSTIELFCDANQTSVQLSLQLDATVNTVDRDAPRDLRSLCETLQAEHPQLVGAGLSVAGAPQASQTRRVQESVRVEIARWGSQQLTYPVDGRDYNITRNAFFQVNRFLTSAMVELVLGDRGGTLALDLFAGAGLFSVPLTERFDQVIAVEIGEPAATDLAAHLSACGPQHSARRSTTLDFLQKQASRLAQTPDLVVLDPPRAGLGAPTVNALSRTGAREIVYVSCDAGTFARDARSLIESGYTLTTLHLLDLFPQTFHTETIAVFRR
ncbi:23S rRNA (uracil-5-)-methyltransferase RumA [Terriglobus roseus DSM 18391]|uniref:23S rRNA (Uracil-5-)-methyltransferase RumA n=1 Tax=Terriglobus roseus (strain DSM 18391 / NRRL B-41598 / KBS 63) TaxID=926566 RepID=I3ZDL5_TERRK|nr:23S rRNA (uracil(1939)-C(5))-methyltransferase RlmD [Terriglobus roseus]AFL87333.1 23S rRNA (uracil-5-)-methyltransferase RumA [Terriglobus roseus DSM 18391]